MTRVPRVKSPNRWGGRLHAGYTGQGTGMGGGAKDVAGSPEVGLSRGWWHIWIWYQGWSRSGEVAMHSILRLFPDLVVWEVTAGSWSLAPEILQRGITLTPDFIVRRIGQEDQNLADSCLQKSTLKLI